MDRSGAGLLAGRFERSLRPVPTVGVYVLVFFTGGGRRLLACTLTTAGRWLLRGRSGLSLCYGDERQRCKCRCQADKMPSHCFSPRMSIRHELLLLTGDWVVHAGGPLGENPAAYFTFECMT
jgi:hypothetical protein